jgi:hypothetical protein
MTFGFDLSIYTEKNTLPIKNVYPYLTWNVYVIKTIMRINDGIREVEDYDICSRI